MTYLILYLQLLSNQYTFCNAGIHSFVGVLYSRKIVNGSSIVCLYIPDKKETHTVRFVKLRPIKHCRQNTHSERNCLKVLSVIDKYQGHQKCMQHLFFFNCMYLLWALTLMHCLRKGSAVYLYQHIVYAFCVFPWRFHVWNVKKGSYKIVWTNI